MVCITSAMTPRCDHLRTLSVAAASRGLRTTARSQVRRRGTPGSSSVSTVRSSPIALLPWPYRHGSMWVCGSGKNDEVIATPLE